MLLGLNYSPTAQNLMHCPSERKDAFYKKTERD